MANAHTLHIPVMGIGFTVDTPLKVSQYGIDSVMALGDDKLLEKLRKMYSERFKLPYQEITDKVEDFRAKRVTSYLNLVKNLAEKKFNEFKNFSNETIQEVKDYFNMLPKDSPIKKEFKNLTADISDKVAVQNWLENNLAMGSLDVNIMTKLDKVNYANNEKLPSEYNDAHAALRGFAKSDLNSSVVLSAGMNPRLYSYFENFEDFYPDVNGSLKKRIVIKVSDYRSALIQGKFFAKKGLWVSEYRIESGLNCGGHAFATEGILLGPILEEFKANKQSLKDEVHNILIGALSTKSKIVPASQLPLKITAQGGVGTSEEHDFLLKNYDLDSVGWGSPFLLVPDVVNIDEETLQQLALAKEKDLYLSEVSPLGVPFNTLKNSSKEIEKNTRVDKGRPGSPCANKFLVFNTEFTEKPICTASRQYQNLKIKELDKENLEAEAHKKNYNKIVAKECLCTGLSTPTLLVNKLNINNAVGKGVSVCPGPNMAYFSERMTLKGITDHIYGRFNVITRNDRPHMFIKEFEIYINFLKARLEETGDLITPKQKKYFTSFIENLKNGRTYYQDLIRTSKSGFETSKTRIEGKLNTIKDALEELNLKILKVTA